MRRDTRFQFEDLLVLLESKDGGSGNEEVLREVLQSDERPLGGETSSLQNGRFLSGGFALSSFYVRFLSRFHVWKGRSVKGVRKLPRRRPLLFVK